MSPLNVITDDEATGPANGAPAAAVAADAPAGSVLAHLRARAAVQRRDRTLDVPVWDGALIARYRPPPMEDADRLIAAAATFVGDGPTASMTHIAVDMMTTCCVTLIGVGEDGATEDLHHTFTGRLLELLALPFPPGVENPGDVTAFEVIESVFGGNWLAVNAHAGTVMSWLQEDAESLGEANGGS